MKSRYDLHNLDDGSLVDRLKTIVAEDNQLTALLLAHLAELDARKLYLPAGCSSMFVYCTSVLKVSEGAAYKRISAARAARRFPIIFEFVASGSVHLAGVCVLAAHLTEENHRALLEKATHLSKRAIEELVAAIAPKPDIAPSIRKVPMPRAAPLLALASPASPPTPAARPAPAPQPAPLSEDRFKVQFTASRALRDKIATAQALMRHRVPNGDLEAVFSEAIDLLLADLNRKKFAATDKPRSEVVEPVQNGRRRIPAAIRRAVLARDGRQCAFVGADGRRCEARSFLEFQHDEPFGKGGEHSVANVRIVCRAHNAHLAERDYGASFMGDRISRRRSAAVHVL